MGQKFTNNARATLAAGVLAADTSLTIDAAKAALFPEANTGVAAVSHATNWFKVTLQNALGTVEIVYVRTRTPGSAILADLLRGQEGTAAANWSAGDVCGLRVTALDIEGRAASGANSDITSIAPTTTIDGSVIGYRDVPSNVKSVDYTLALSDAGKHILHPAADTAARVLTIPANAAVAFPIGTAITIVNQNAAGVITIAITTDVMRLAGQGTVGSRALAANGIATLLKIAATEWIIAGTGLS